MVDLLLYRLIINYMATSANINPADGAAKLATVIKPLLDEVSKSIREYGSANTQELLLAVEKLSARFDVLEKLVGEKKKPVRTEKKEVVVGTPVETGTEVATPVDPNARKNFANNKLVYFRDQFKTNPVYRARYVTPEVQALMEKDDTIKVKTNELQKLAAQAIFCWNYFKANKADVYQDIDVHFQAAKKAYDEANKPQQQTADEHTPPPVVVQ